MRYYYDCPVEAAYMVKNFGLIVDPEIQFQAIAVDGGLTILGVGAGNHFLHPDSVKLLEPQLYDIFLIDGSPSWITDVREHYVSTGLAKEDYSDNIQIKDLIGCPILQRDGKVFIMPKVEEATQS